MSIAVFSATGHLGGSAVESLLRRGVEPGGIVAAGRNAERLAELAARGIRTARIDLDDPESLRAPLAGAQRLLFISVNGSDRRVAQHRNVITAAADAGVEQVVYTSFASADRTTIHFDHKATEEALREIGVPHVVLRNPPYFEFFTSWIPRWRELGRIEVSAGTGRVSSAARDDLGDAAAAVVLGSEPDGAVYELGGADPFSMAELAAEITRQTGDRVEYVPVSVERCAEVFVGEGMGDVAALHLAKFFWAIETGEVRTDTGDLGRILGRPQRTIAEAVAYAIANPDAEPRHVPPKRSSEGAPDASASV